MGWWKNYRLSKQGKINNKVKVDFMEEQLQRSMNMDFTVNIVSETQQKKEEYKSYLNLLKEKAQNPIFITEKNNNLIFLGEYTEEYPEIHIVEIYEDINKTFYRLDK
jgi:hypothetical protein